MTVLEDIVADVRADVAIREAHVSLDNLKVRAMKIPPAKNAYGILKTDDHRAVRIISEIKRKSPSRGHLAGIEDPAKLAQIYEDGGSAAVSVFTEHKYFGGCLDDLDAVRRSIEIPVLSKDFIVSPYQIWEARAHGADMVLLVVAALEQIVLESFVERVHSLGMTALVEAHNQEEALRAVDAGAIVIGVNARNMNTFDVDLKIFDRVVDVLPRDALRIAESGVRTPQDVLNYARSGADAVLVGEALVTSANPLQTIRDMVAIGEHPSLTAMKR
ncbi:indole-3-glycerol phosphate synthase [Arcanobacterium pluranimalium]|uniref:indole-3-glycerol phosphate synthase TrpC n=1 Tax=Arcanobacterium pluranimalium TaxID=108028 RepID=UPI0019590940|nr:indole-3-glycerol phosphate synthase TrpC [Arcanobacterium pluranimalium]MBM7825378.1 indole-3-glycerol phosphate synthase [Arcanobacterium pluranimalium]